MLRSVRPVLIFFIVITALVLVFSPTLERNGVSTTFLYSANTLLIALTLVAFFWQHSGARSKNHHAFMRSILGSLMIKMFVVIIAFLLYIFLSGRQINKPALFISMGLYLLYTTIEIRQLLKNLRSNNNGKERNSS